MKMYPDLLSEPREARTKPRGSLAQTTDESLIVKKRGLGWPPDPKFFCGVSDQRVKIWWKIKSGADSHFKVRGVCSIYKHKLHKIPFHSPASGELKIASFFFVLVIYISNNPTSKFEIPIIKFKKNVVKYIHVIIQDESIFEFTNRF